MQGFDSRMAIGSAGIDLPGDDLGGMITHSRLIFLFQFRISDLCWNSRSMCMVLPAEAGLLLVGIRN